MSYMNDPYYDNPLEEKPEQTKEVQRWADAAMFRATPMGDAGKEGGPKVYLLGATADPLGTVAAVNEMYTGGVVRRLADVTDAQRRRHWGQVTKTELKSPFEFVQFHFLLDGVTRALTHQLVRQRMGTYAQESLRFAVKEDLGDAVGLPPSLAGTKSWDERMNELEPQYNGMDKSMYRAEAELERIATDADRARWKWDAAIENINAAYKDLIESGTPAEDARGLLPTNTLTRVHYRIDLRNLMNMAGVRLCTQAQFEWRLVWAQMVKAIREYGYDKTYQRPASSFGNPPQGTLKPFHHENWQFQLIADLFKPICYQKGSCQFLSEDDRTCSIRNRVQANADIGRSSEHWDEEYEVPEKMQGEIFCGVGPHSTVRTNNGQPVFIGAIQPVEWLADPTAARKNGGGHLGGER